MLASFVAAEAEPNEAHVLSLTSHQHHGNKKNETSSLNVKPDSVDSVEVSPLPEASDLEWPWSGKKDDKNKTLEDHTCRGHANCTTCAENSWCHWCSHGQSCHARGSVYGCAYGASCDRDDDHHKNETDPSGCTAHGTCGECALASHFCHWCAHDNACHDVGSRYGCVTGVDCYSNDRCKRTEPEPITDTVFTQIGPLPLLVLAILCALLFCCASTCFCVASGVKGAYDDLAGLAGDQGRMREPLLEQPRQQSRITQVPVVPVDTAAAVDDAADADVDVDSEQVVGDDTANDSVHMVLSEEGNNADDYVRVADDEEGANVGTEENAPLLVVPQQRTARRPRHMQRLYNTCTACYIVTVTVIAVLFVGTVRYFPSKPTYSICNDNVAWKSLIDSMASMKVSADFEILASVNNPNHFDVALDMGKSKVNRSEPDSLSRYLFIVTDLLVLFPIFFRQGKFPPRRCLCRDL